MGQESQHENHQRMEQSNKSGGHSRLSETIRARRCDLLADWEDAFRLLPTSRELDQPTLTDHVPDILDRIADIAEQIEAGAAPESALIEAKLHAIGRLGRGFALSQVVAELGLLRDCILTRTWSGGDQDATHLLEIRILNQAIDKVVTASIGQYTVARDRILRELDQIITAAIEMRTLDDMLRSLLRVMVVRTSHVDTVAILLRDGDVLRVRAAVGLDLDPSFALRVGEGFAGGIAAEGQPRALASASTDSLIINPALRKVGIRALYGVPLIDGDEVIGVVHMGSLTRHEFPREDQLLLEVVASRAHAAIHQHMLRETAERTADRLRESESQLQTLADNIPQLAWMADGTGAVSWYNRRWLEFAGMTLEDAKGSGWQKVQHPDHLSSVVARFERALASGQGWEDTFPMRGKDGRYRWFLTRAVPIHDANGNVTRWFGTNTDVTEQRFLAEATKLLGSSLNYHDTLEKLAQLAVPDIADWCVVDIIEETGPRRIAIAHANPENLELARNWAQKQPPDWSEPRGIAQVIRTGQPEFIRDISEEFLGELVRDAEQLAAARSLGLISAIAVPLIARGRTLGALALLTAESGRHYEASDVEPAMELGRRAGIAIDNARLYREAQEATRLRERILAIVSHDLRNPLSAIDLSASAILEDRSLAVRARKSLEIIVRSTHRMHRMIGDLLELAQIQLGSLTLDCSLQDGATLLSDCVEPNELLARNKGIEIVQERDIDSVRVLCDRQRIEQVFSNLLGNSIKYCHAGDTIVVRTERAGDRVRYTIRDTGPGIPVDELPHIFEAYWSGTHHKAGLGLGLYISKGIVDAHGGEMWAESEGGTGATFVVTLPIAQQR